MILDLTKKGLSGEEAFIIGVRRTGKVSSVAAEFSKVHSRSLWKQLFIEPFDPADLRRSRRESVLVAVLALLAGALSRTPEIFGIELFGEGDYFYLRNLSFLILPTVVCYFAWKFPDRRIHVPMLLWLAAGAVYSGKEWRSAETLLRNYIAVIGGCAAPVVAVYLASTKRNIIENMAPVLARIFSPLFLVLMVVFIAVMAATGRVLSVDRDILIGFDLLLAVSARIRDFGSTPNKTAALGENLILLVNLAVSGVLYFRFFKAKEGFRSLTLWQTRFLPVVALWASAVAFLFPVLFKQGYWPALWTGARTRLIVKM